MAEEQRGEGRPSSGGGGERLERASIAPPALGNDWGRYQNDLQHPNAPSRKWPELSILSEYKPNLPALAVARAF